MIFGNLQTQRQELRHLAFVDVHELAVFRGEHQWRRMPEIYKTEISVWTYFAVQHGRDLARMIFVADSKRVSRADRLRQAQVDVFKKFRRRLSVVVKFGQHEGVKCVMHRGSDLR